MDNGSPFQKSYPNLAHWAETFGWVEIGQDDFSTSFIRILDIGGMIWESNDHYNTVDTALRDAEAAISRWIQEQNFEDVP